MSKDEIQFPITFVVFDMEWNQPISYMPSPVNPKDLPGEIIEIGAVKLTMESETCFSMSRPFSIIVKPQFYKIMNRQVSRVINKNTDDLKRGVTFPEAYDYFLKWCGDDYVLCAWGDSDISILKSNLKIHGMPAEVNERFLDIQPLFGRIAENTAQQRSVAYAVDFYRIPQTDDFHSADKDAYYEARILKETLTDYFVMCRKENANEDIEIPRLKHYISNPNLNTQYRWKTGVFPNEKEAVARALKEELHCPVCSELIKATLEWFSSGHTWMSLWQCAEHGPLTAKIRAKKTPQQEFYGSGQLRFVNGNAARYVQEKWEEKQKKGSETEELPEKCSENVQNCEQL
ncbi:MAG: exonuclease domain-containing protein [Clostridiales bacterium]|nr:exonuclease domain-containing protein [Clostridiales bacterium]